MNNNIHLQKSSNKSRSDEKKSINRKVSIATVATAASKPITVPKKYISSTVSDSRRPSTPLSIAERFMSNHHDPKIINQNTIITKKEDGKEAINNNSLKTAYTVAPENQNDRLSVYSPPSLFLSFDPHLENVNQVYDFTASHSSDDVALKNSNIRKNVNCNSDCSKKHNNKRKSKTNIQNKQHQYCRANKIDIIKTVDDDIVPEKDEAIVGIWIGSCCFIQYGNSNKQQPILPTKQRNSKVAKQFCCCWGRRTWVIATFLAVVMVAVLIFFFWPRIPLIRIEGATNTIPTKVTQTQQGGRTSNVAFESTWLLNITMDNRRNIFTTRFNRIQIIAKDAMTGLLIGKGLNNNVEAGIVVYLPGKEISTIQLPISVNYQARDDTDPTFSNLIRACSTNSTLEMGHHSLSIHFWFTLYIFGLDWLGYKSTLIATPATGGFFCPSSSII
ncbi:hypothetical protein INT46_006283 [Mucor plumbeus]|uniref:Uncharacterized protein n=1 Tax=Mucor plumbeus TaxID=97098 RepID=A0A8H7RDT1_9FUNG|nr:hypothetical protein INT46_006283 [Mucor plumbeus]